MKKVLFSLFWLLLLVLGLISSIIHWHDNWGYRFCAVIVVMAILIQLFMLWYAVSDYRWQREQVKCDLCGGSFPRGVPWGHGYGECVDLDKLEQDLRKDVFTTTTGRLSSRKLS